MRHEGEGGGEKDPAVWEANDVAGLRGSSVGVCPGHCSGDPHKHFMLGCVACSFLAPNLALPHLLTFNHVTSAAPVFTLPPASWPTPA